MGLNQTSAPPRWLAAWQELCNPPSTRLIIHPGGAAARHCCNLNWVCGTGCDACAQLCHCLQAPMQGVNQQFFIKPHCPLNGHVCLQRLGIYPCDRIFGLCAAIAARKCTEYSLAGGSACLMQLAAEPYHQQAPATYGGHAAAAEYLPAPVHWPLLC